MKYQLLASDLDGTLLGTEGDVSRENWQAIEEMKRRGIVFAPASGRSFGEMPAQLRESPLIRYYITSGGATVCDKEKGIFDTTPIPPDVVQRVLATLKDCPVCMLAHDGRASHTDALLHNEKDYAYFRMNEYWVDFAMKMEKPEENFKEYLSSMEKVAMLVIFFRNAEDLDACKAVFDADPELLVVQTDSYNVELVSSRAGKGNALLKLAQLVGIPQEATVAVGDSGNDLSMIRAAGLGLAMKNSTESVLHYADEVICDHTEHAAAYILQHYFQEN